MIGGSLASEEEETHTPPAPLPAPRRVSREIRPPTPPVSRSAPATEDAQQQYPVFSGKRPDFLPEPLPTNEEERTAATQSATSGRDDGEDSGHSFASADHEDAQA